MMHVAVGIKVFHFVIFQGCALDVFSRTESDFSGRSVFEAAQLSLNECTKIAGCSMLKVEHAIWLAVVNNYHPASDVVCVHLGLIPFECQYVTNLAHGPTSENKRWG